MTGRRLELLTAFGGVLTLAYLLFVIFFTADEAIIRTIDNEAWETSVDLVAVWPSRWLLPIGLGAMALVVFIQTVRQLRGEAAARRTSTGEKEEPGP